MSALQSTDWRALLAGVRADPDNDLPRLVAADWLEEHGEDAWASRIRWQVEHPGRPNSGCQGDRSVGLPCGSGDDECDTCRWIQEHGYPGRLAGEDLYEFRRGFVETVRVHDFDAWGLFGPAAVKCPLTCIRSVSVSGASPRVWASPAGLGHHRIAWRHLSEDVVEDLRGHGAYSRFEALRSTHVPDWVLSRLTNPIVDHRGSGAVYYGDEGEAFRDLSRALITYAVYYGDDGEAHRDLSRALITYAEEIANGLTERVV